MQEKVKALRIAHKELFGDWRTASTTRINFNGVHQCVLLDIPASLSSTPRTTMRDAL